MKRKLLMLATLLRALAIALFVGPPVVRAFTRDIAFPFRMGAGFPGDVNRMHPASIVAGMINTTVQPPRAYGDPVLFDAATNSHRGVVAADGSATPAMVAGFMVRPYPTQQMVGGMDAAIGAAAPPTSGIADFVEEGFVMVRLPAGAVAAKGGQVHVWCAASASGNVQGQCVVAANGTNTLSLTNARFHGPADADGNAEVRIWAGR
jgi:hypothetical protein